MSNSRKHAPQFHVGDWVSLLHGTRRILAQVVEDRGPLGVQGRRLYRVRPDQDPNEAGTFEAREEYMQAAAKAYLDNNVVCALAKDDVDAAESAALDSLMELSDRDAVWLQTSRLSLDEMEQCSKPEKLKTARRFYRALEKGKFIDDHTLLGFHNQWDRTGGVSYPLIEDDPCSAELRRMGLDRTDAHHVMLAIRNGCSYFVTCDSNSILKYRAAVEAKYPQIKLRKPSELVAELAAAGAN